MLPYIANVLKEASKVSRLSSLPLISDRWQFLLPSVIHINFVATKVFIELLGTQGHSVDLYQ